MIVNDRNNCYLEERFKGRQNTFSKTFFKAQFTLLGNYLHARDTLGTVINYHKVQQNKINSYGSYTNF